MGRYSLSRILAALILMAAVLLVHETAEYVSVLAPQAEIISVDKDITVVVDAGHGGVDPGKVGINGALEKDINLAIALKLERNLKENGINVVMTRHEDIGLYKEKDTNKKVNDLKNRLAIIEEAQPVLAISIHQNSYPDESVNGVQVFYYADSKEGKKAADIMQKQMVSTLNPRKQRQAKDNSSYYLLEKTSVPLLIVECAFLSNPEEAKLLLDNKFQEKVAWSVYLGIMQYINDK